VASFSKEIRNKHLEKSQFPLAMKDAAGKFYCPADWRP
jgi:hypothetical protein